MPAHRKEWTQPETEKACRYLVRKLGQVNLADFTFGGADVTAHTSMLEGNPSSGALNSWIAGHLTKKGRSNLMTALRVSKKYQADKVVVDDNPRAWAAANADNDITIEDIAISTSRMFYELCSRMTKNSTDQGNMTTAEGIKFLKSQMGISVGGLSSTSDTCDPDNGMYKMVTVHPRQDTKEKGRDQKWGTKYTIPFRMTLLMEVDYEADEDKEADV